MHASILRAAPTETSAPSLTLRAAPTPAPMRSHGRRARKVIETSCPGAGCS